MDRKRRLLFGNNVGRSGGASLAPPLTSIAAWYQKGIGITSAGGKVSIWADQSGNGRDLLQGTGANQPDLQGDSTILFDGSAQNMKATAFTLNQPVTIYARLKQITWSVSDTLMDGNTGNSYALADTTGSPGVSVVGGAATLNNDLTLNVWHSLGYGQKTGGTTSFLQVDSNAETTSVTAGTNPAGFTLGAFGGGGLRYANIQVAEIIIYSVAHTLVERAQAIAYLDTK